MTITKWNPEAVKAEVMNTLVANGEIVGKFLEGDAKRRLMAITEPEWGKNYRQKYVARLLMFEVERGRSEVVIKVGVGTSKSGKHHGFYIELGSKSSPPHPFLRPAVFDNAKKIVGLLSGK